ncbi:Aste57867_11386 [Aphanomyces stellatus]|uniref:Aste57867_11386 protein n=1 Tax=Aphanomyces stellatus TaxID=120398 RepID=A0A485KT96_9STRA|nr:hypothetical protein As57867_011344 [Aphanomyces stellatus]VFT88247.1 Aste57867_11386 [Aphanomyces stellatus]
MYSGVGPISFDQSLGSSIRGRMLTFKEKLAHHLIPEWEAYYVNYSELKYHVKQIQRRQSFLNMSGNDYQETDEGAHLVKTSKPTHFEQEFLGECEKVDTWYCSRLDEYRQQFGLLQDQYAAAVAAREPVVPKELVATPDGEAFHLERHSIKQSFVELYKMLRMLQNFALLNYTALRKILKKHKKKCGDRFDKAHRALNDALHEYDFSHALPVKECIVQLEAYFAATFHENDRVLALAELDDWKDSTLNWQHVYIGLKMGICMILAMWLLWDDVMVVALRKDPSTPKLMQTKAYPFYRGNALFLFFLWLWGGTLYCWQSARINYRYICELDPHATADFSQVFEDASHLSILYFINFILYVEMEHQTLPEYFPRGYLPLSFCVYVFCYFASKEWGKQRRLARIIHDIILLPLFPVSYFHTLVTNYMTSAAKMNQDFAWSVCYFTTGEFLDTTTPESFCANDYYYVRVVVPLISALPLWWRCMQSLRRVYELKSWFPGVLNALKYALSQMVVLFGLFHSYYSPVQPSNTMQIGWIVLFVVSSLYSWLWDVVMDWGLGRPQYHFLGDGHMYSRKWIYYVAIAVDFVLIFSWTLALIPPTDEYSFMGFLLYLQPITMYLEPIRRSMWACFAMENEHLRNTLGFRKEKFIPLHFDRKPAKPDQEDTKHYAYKVGALAAVVVALSASAIFLF